MARTHALITSVRFVLIATLAALGSALFGAAASPPNIVFIVADDLGRGDLACIGHAEIKTPHLDRLAREGLKLTACYSGSANCSPARAAIMTGRTPYRAGSAER